MFPKIPNPAWPHEIIEIFDTETAETPLGCGRCCNAELTSETRNDKTYFVVALCRAGIPIDNGEAKQYCTAYMKPAAGFKGQSNSVESPTDKARFTVQPHQKFN